MSITTNYSVKNFGYGTLAFAINNAQTSITMNSGHNFSLDVIDFFKLIIWDDIAYPNPANDPNLEIVTANYSGVLNVYTVDRAEENTVAVSHASGSGCAMTITAELFQSVQNSKKNQLFLSSGSFIAKSEIVYLTMISGGGGGATKQLINGGGGGSSSPSLIKFPFFTVIGNTYSVVIGNGGSGNSPGTDLDGGDGGVTSFDTLSVPGGLGGKSNGNGGLVVSPVIPIAPSGGGIQYIGSQAGGDNSSLIGGGGGGSLFGPGADGGISTMDGDNGVDNTGVGGGGGGNTAGSGDGGSGFCLVEW